MAAATAVLFLFTFTLLLSTSVQLPQLQPQPGGCSAVLVAFSPCLPYVSEPPNSMAETVPSQCCDVVNSAFNSDHGDCLCEPLRQPLIFGFPLNETRLLSLSSVCHSSGSLESICSSESSPTSPPLRGVTTGPEIPKPHDSDKLPQLPPLQIPKPPDSGKLPQLPPLQIPKPPDSGKLPQLPPHQIPKPPESGKLPQLPPLQIPKPPDSGEQPQMPFPRPSDSGKQPQLPLPPLPFPKRSGSGNQHKLPLPPLPLPKPSDSGNGSQLPLPPLHGTTGPQFPNPFDSGHGNVSVPSQAVTSPTITSSSVQVSGGSFPTKQIYKSSSWFLSGLVISLLVFIHM